MFTYGNIYFRWKVLIYLNKDTICDWNTFAIVVHEFYKKYNMLTHFWGELSSDRHFPFPTNYDTFERAPLFPRYNASYIERTGLSIMSDDIKAIVVKYNSCTNFGTDSKCSNCLQIMIFLYYIPTNLTRLCCSIIFNGIQYHNHYENY